MSCPTVSGYYWIVWKNSDRPEIVRVVMDYTFRRKVVPFVLGQFWKGPLSNMHDVTWSEKIQCPFFNPEGL
jgi:hypothetical protein